MTEEEVYQGSKNYLVKQGYIVVAGQPPRGVDHIPVIEIKEDTTDKGSRFAYKPDLVAYKNDSFVIIECKPTFNYGDYIKLKSVIDSRIRLLNFYNELKQYRIFDKIDCTLNFEDFKTNIEISLAYSGEKPTGYDDINHIIVSDWRGIAQSTL